MRERGRGAERGEREVEETVEVKEGYREDLTRITRRSYNAEPRHVHRLKVLQVYVDCSPGGQPMLGGRGGCPRGYGGQRARTGDQFHT